MRYRAEIDGLRAVAVIPVILFHAGLDVFSGGFVGVDVFFVISGYLITFIILSDLRGDGFTITSFYERRARRILPALFLVMFVSLVFAYLWMLPDELENFGQSLLATTIFSNNILLTLTSGYWALASEFKPLLHTWSLGVEEQFYVVYPIMLMAGWKYFRRYLVAVLALLAVISLVGAHWGVSHYPDATFYLLPTRGWELLLGAFVTFYTIDRPRSGRVTALEQLLSISGFLLITCSVIFFSEGTPSPSLYTLVPTVGTALIILYTREGTIIHRILSTRWIVGLGLISYSAYLWHHPLFAFARIYSVEEPSSYVMVSLSVLSVALAFLSWRFLETPFRTKGRLSRRFIFSFSLIVSILFVSVGLYLNLSHGVPTRIFPDELASSDDMYISYNEGAFAFKKDTFSSPDSLNLLIIGDSYSRDFVNMTIETFDMEEIELIYRDDYSGCFSARMDDPAEALLGSADVIVLASNDIPLNCVDGNIRFTRAIGSRLFYAGPKHFGYNLNWLVRVDEDERKSRYNPLPSDVAQAEMEMAAAIPSEQFISLLNPTLRDGRIPITDELGRLISADRAHLTRHGAKFMGNSALAQSTYGEILRRAHSGPSPGSE